MNFVFPKNYNFKAKLFGFIDYSTIIFLLCFAIILYLVIDFIFENLNIKLYIFIASFFPVFIFSVIGIGKENIISVFIYIFKFFKNQRIYLYEKNYDI